VGPAKTDPELLEYLCRADRQFIIEFEKVLKAQFNRSAFDKPGEWGTRKGEKEEDLPALVKKLRLAKALKGPPMSVNRSSSKLIYGRRSRAMSSANRSRRT